jgi:tartronate-semialdehyde synthase
MNVPGRSESFNVFSRRTISAALVEARALAQKHRVPVVVEVIMEKVTNIAMGTEIDRINEFEDIECLHPEGREGLVAAGLLE